VARSATTGPATVDACVSAAGVVRDVRWLNLAHIDEPTRTGPLGEPRDVPLILRHRVR